MSTVNELVAELCPDGVPFVRLGDVATIARGQSLTKAQTAVGPVPVLAGGRSPAYYHDKSNRSGETIVVAGSGAYAGFVSWWDQPIWVSDAFSVVSSSEAILNRYCYHFLLSQQDVIHQFKSGGGVPHVYPKQVAELRIPVPPVEVQSEIVRILDKFTALEAELEAELEARRLQYEHYRNALIASSAEDSAARTLGDVFNMRAGKATASSLISPTADAVHQVPCFGGGGLRGFVSGASHNGDVVLVGRQGALCGNVSRVSGEFFATEHAVVVQAKDDVDMSWAFHVLTEMDLNQYATKSAQPGLAVSTLEKVPIMVPDVETQSRVAHTLNTMSSLLEDIQSGLPAEIAARRKQYEYYRELLLTFKELES